MVELEQSVEEETNQAGTPSISNSVPKNEGNIIGIYLRNRSFRLGASLAITYKFF